jgi:hypothetical protein
LKTGHHLGQLWGSLQLRRNNRGHSMADADARKRAKKIAQARGLGGMANDTKWREFFSEVTAQHIPMEVKLLYEEVPFECGRVWSPAQNYVEGGGGMGPELFVFIEWVQSAEAMKVQVAAAAIGLECEVRDGLATVYGYR